MKTQDEILKIKSALLYILRSFPEGVDIIKIFKILYFAQQKHLVKYGRPIVRETFYAIEKGPVPSFTYKAFQVALSQNHSNADEMILLFNRSFEIIRKRGITYVKGIGLPDLDELSASDLKEINESISENKDIPSLELSKKSHDVAWEEAYQRGLDDPEKDIMTILDIAKAGKASPEMINYIRETEIYQNYLSL